MLSIQSLSTRKLIQYLLITLSILIVIGIILWSTNRLNPFDLSVTANEHWQIATPMSVPRSEIAVAALDDKIYVAGGISLLRITDHAEVYDVEQDSWTAIANLPYALHHVALAACGKRLFAAGGYSGINFEHDRTPKLWYYDGPDNRWVEEAELPNPLGEHAMTCLQNQLYIVGGRDLTSETAAVWTYDLATGQWQRKPDMPTPRHSMALAIVDEWLYVIGGRNSIQGAHVDVVEAYHMLEERWETRTPLPIGRGGHTAVALQGQIHVLGGERFDTGEVLNSHHIYHPSTDSWQEAPALAAARHGLAATVVNDRLYVIGGGARYGLYTIYSVTGTVQIYQPQP